MPYIGSSSSSQHSFDNLKEKHSITKHGASTSSSRLSISHSNDTNNTNTTTNNNNNNKSNTNTNNNVNTNSTNDNDNDNDNKNMITNDNSKISCSESDSQSISSSTNTNELHQPPSVSINSSRSLSISSMSSTTDIDSAELISLPNESTHVYSYNPLSPNSLAVRLKILKRSLEIMIGNPDMLKDPSDGSLKHARHLSQAIAENAAFSRDRFDSPGLSGQSSTKFNNFQQTKWSAHSAALKAFVTNSATSSAIHSPTRSSTQLSNISNISNLQRATSLVFLPDKLKGINSGSHSDSIKTFRRISDAHSHNTLVENKESFYKNISASHSNEIVNSRMSDLEKLLDLLNETLENNTSAKASDLHMISLLNIDKLNIGNELSDSQGLSRTLLDSLAEPFFEHQNVNDERSVDDEKELQEEMHEFVGQDDLSFNNLRPQQDYGRLLHTFTSVKNSAPHAIFTCTQQFPWQFKAANDLACLTFGISKNALRALTLLDLIHSDNRNFVLNKIMTSEGKEIVFSGEIVAIAQPGNNNSSNLIWASFWAKRKNGLLVCVFEKVPCDYMDIKLSLEDFSVDDIINEHGLFNENIHSGSTKSMSDEAIDLDSQSTISSTTTKENKKKSVKFANEIHDISTISRSLADVIQQIVDGKLVAKDDSLYPVSIRVSNHLNEIRYFTLNHLSYNIPCAVSASILENELKLKIHSLPYEAGLFIIDSNKLQLISFNKSISKNLFGIHFNELVGKPITDIIPSFADIIKFISVRYPALDITHRKNKGLVLTEHFFRKIQAEMNGDAEDFYTSVGIDALHRDGCFIKIDFQLRVVNSNIAFLWITHSRDVVIKDYTSTPSQLHMLKETEVAFVSSGNSSATSSKRSSSKISVSSLPEMTQLSIDESLLSNSHSHSQTPIKETKNTLDSSKSEARDEIKKILKIDNGIDLNDKELQEKLELAKVYVKDKSQFVKEGNFRVDGSLIMSMASSPKSSKSNTSLVTLDDSNKVSSSESLSKENIGDSSGILSSTEGKTTFLYTPEQQIGAQKRTKKISDFVILQKMGEGAYGKVNLCLHKKKKYIVVIKMIFKERILVDTWVRDRQLGTILSEIQIMSTLNKHPHDNILRLLDFFEDDDYYYIETPMHGETGCIDLFDLIEFKTNMSEVETKLIFMQVVSSIKFLHDQGIVHRDIKDENVIVDSQGFIKLIDFGSAAYVKSGPFDVFVGTIDYAAPEVLGGEPYVGKPQDIWAIGILLYTIIFKENPFYNIDEILEAELKFNTSTGACEDCVDLIKRILTRNPTKRPTIDEIYNDKWLQF
ncbi:hypothetical protein Kpol_1040p20 [Vanderwaltozyma polyspora DSM 70294]|uniref:non-specific serine/threonine protein kinase n=1 Tax=Vanderwaltozyma polyspora (strain ATCC 22028 / DSM 70294 / BCRC 21397 / CBS 2163 / NBRC 10782 / NRRL Y-8283 / UCD 57-17) TaxID=436907 RepID=A7TPL5_VANPO|nr:uncharacterized protein Kpol_1040p20 [Vanderwaltozyma polyspora DSM 70294]EDO15807.1 hypothetical protein Kpol_1040p20 [Vanderwaltozyma polyspora DSM 70294]